MDIWAMHCHCFSRCVLDTTKDQSLYSFLLCFLQNILRCILLISTISSWAIWTWKLGKKLQIEAHLVPTNSTYSPCSFCKRYKHIHTHSIQNLSASEIQQNCKVLKTFSVRFVSSIHALDVGVVPGVVNYWLHMNVHRHLCWSMVECIWALLRCSWVWNAILEWLLYFQRIKRVCCHKFW